MKPVFVLFEGEIDGGTFAASVFGSQGQRRFEESRLTCPFGVDFLAELVAWGEKGDVVSVEAFDFEFVEDPRGAFELGTEDRAEQFGGFTAVEVGVRELFGCFEIGRFYGFGRWPFTFQGGFDFCQGGARERTPAFAIGEGRRGTNRKQQTQER